MINTIYYKSLHSAVLAQGGLDLLLPALLHYEGGKLVKCISGRTKSLLYCLYFHFRSLFAGLHDSLTVQLGKILDDVANEAIRASLGVL